jgi:exodeoxyribonuclease VII small subunit
MAKKSPQSPPRNFEEALNELEAILQEIEAGNLGLEASLAKYERGNFLIQHCRGVLNAAEKQIDLISGNADGVSISPLKLREEELQSAQEDDEESDDAEVGADEE